MARIYQKNGQIAKKLGKIKELGLYPLRVSGNDPCQATIDHRRGQSHDACGGRGRGCRSDMSYRLGLVRFDAARPVSTQRGEVSKTMAKKAATPAAKAAKPATKADVISALAEKTNLGKKEVGGVIAALSDLVAKELGKKGPGIFVLPGLLKLKVVRKPATKAKQGVNPFTKEPMTIKAKPGRNVVLRGAPEVPQGTRLSAGLPVRD